MEGIEVKGPEELREPAIRLSKKVREYYSKERAEPKEFNIEIGIGDGGKYVPHERKIYVYINPFYIPDEIRREPFEKRKKFYQIASPVIKNLKKDEIEYIFKVFKKYHLYDEEETLEDLLYDLNGILLTFSHNFMDSPIYKKEPIMRNLLNKLAKNYMEDEELFQQVYATAMHETAHKMVWETHSQFHELENIKNNKRLKKILFQADNEIFASELGESIKIAYNEQYIKELDELLKEYYREKARYVRDKLGSKWEEIYKLLVRLRGADENIAYAMQEKATSWSVFYDIPILRGNIFDEILMTNHDLKETTNWLNKHKFGEILEMKLKEIAETFTTLD